jgi:hypothetical protein
MLRVLILFATVCVAVTFGDLTASSFRHHFIATEMPGPNVGIGSSALVDLDRDRDMDFVVLNRGDKKLYWFEQKNKTEWMRHVIGELPTVQLGCATTDVDADGWPDILVGGYWFRNNGKPAAAQFQRFRYDSAIRSEIHDIVTADVNGDGDLDVVAMGDGEGCFWYSIPKNPAQNVDWEKITITTDVLNDRVDIHSGFYPAGVGDLDGDRDADVFLADRWMENGSNGKSWTAHRVFFGKRGPWGFSARSAIVDLDSDGDNDIVVTDSDGQNSAVAWLENSGKPPRRFTARYLANKAPGTRGSFHSLRLADFDNDGDQDIFVVEQEDPSILPLGAGPRWYIWENVSSGGAVRFEERVILDRRLGGHDAWVGDVDGDGDMDIVAKIWRVWPRNGNSGRVHIGWLENLTR